MTGAGPRLIGRSAELARLREYLGDASAGHPRIVLCSGEPGIGKTALMRALADDAEAAGVQVRWARSLELPDAPPYWLWHEIVGTETIGRATECGIATSEIGAETPSRWTMPATRSARNCSLGSPKLRSIAATGPTPM